MVDHRDQCAKMLFWKALTTKYCPGVNKYLANTVNCADIIHQTSGVHASAGALAVTISRISGICIGVGVSLLISVIVYPSSATVKALACMRQVSSATMQYSSLTT